MQAVDVVIPELELKGAPLRLTAWHVATGQPVLEGDRLLEVTAPGVTIDLPVPATGILRHRLVAIDDPLQVGQRVAIVECRE